MPYVRADLVNAGTAVADERAAFEAWLTGNRFDKSETSPGVYLSHFTRCAWQAWQARAALAAPKAEAPTLLAKKHEGLRVDYAGLLRQCRDAIPAKSGFLRFSLEELQGHLKELGQRWYAGDTAVVDEILQLYCIEREARASLSAPPAHQGATHHE